LKQVEWGPIYLATGVTTARDVGNEREFILAVRDAIAGDKGIGPRMLLAGIVDGTSPVHWEWSAWIRRSRHREQVQRYKAEGFQQIKVYSSVN